jgi:hypothetical protein
MKNATERKIKDNRRHPRKRLDWKRIPIADFVFPVKPSQTILEPAQSTLSGFISVLCAYSAHHLPLPQSRLVKVDQGILFVSLYHLLCVRLKPRAFASLRLCDNQCKPTTAVNHLKYRLSCCICSLSAYFATRWPIPQSKLIKVNQGIL